MPQKSHTTNLINYKVEPIYVDGKLFKTVTRNGLAMIPFTEVLIDYQLRSKSGAANAYYLCKFLDFLLFEFGISNIADVKKAHIVEFYRYLKKLSHERGLRHDGKEGQLGNATLKKYGLLLDAVFDALYVGGYEIHESLSLPVRPIRRKSLKTHYTTAGDTLRDKMDYKQKYGKKPMEEYTKWLTDEQIDAVSSVADLRDRCIFKIGLETGYRISSVLSIENRAEDLSKAQVEETFSKTGLLHAAVISQSLAADIARYVSGERADIVADVGFDCGALFLIRKGKNKGNPLTTSGYYKRLEKIETDVHMALLNMQDLKLHSHACRSTFLDRLVCENDKRRLHGQEVIPDIEICRLMDWRSMDNLDAYYNYHRAINPVPKAALEFEERIHRGDLDEN